jgi:hypothetical protein
MPNATDVLSNATRLRRCTIRNSGSDATVAASTTMDVTEPDNSVTVPHATPPATYRHRCRALSSASTANTTAPSDMCIPSICLCGNTPFHSPAN